MDAFQRLSRAIAVAVSLCALSGCGESEDDKKFEDADYHYQLANTAFYEKQIHGALSELQRCLELDPKHPDAHHLMGFIYFGRKEYALAESHFRKALEIRGAFNEARANLGAVLLASKRWKDAIETLEPLLQVTLYPTPWLIHNNIAFAHQHLRQHAVALKHYRQAVFLNPQFCLAYNNLGTLYRELKQPDMAKDYLGRAITRCKTYQEPHFHMGELYEQEGRLEDARTAYAQCYKTGPESPLGRRCRVRM